MADTERLSLDGDTPERDEDLNTTIRKSKKDIRGFAARNGEMPSLEDILSDDLGDPADFAAEAEDRPRTEDFTSAKRLYADDTIIPPKEKPKRTTSGGRKYKESRYVATDAEERRWATLAHGSALLTMAAALFSAGTLSLFTLMIPLAIYFYWRRKSEYVAFQALQAFTLQVLGTVGWLAFLVVGTLLFALITVILALTVVGLLLMIVLVPLFVILVLASFGLPISMVVFSIIAMTQTNEGKQYRLPRIGRWIDHQMYNGFLSEM